MTRDKKTALTPTEKLTASWAHIVQGVDQHTLAAIYGVNAGRIAEAVSAARIAFGIEKITAVYNYDPLPPGPSNPDLPEVS